MRETKMVLRVGERKLEVREAESGALIGEVDLATCDELEIKE